MRLKRLIPIASIACFLQFGCKAREISPPPSERVGPRNAATNQTTLPPGDSTLPPGQQGLDGSGNANANPYNDGFYYQNLENKTPSGTPSTPPPPSQAPPPRVDCKATKQVYAFYYGWFAGAEHGGWNGIEVSHGDRPAYGPYDSANETKITYDINVAKQIGLNGFAVAWIGDHPNDVGKNKPNQVLKILLRKAREMGFCVAALFEAEMIYTQYGMNVSTQMNTLVNTLNTYPDNTFRINNKPVVFMWKNELVPAATWRALNSSGKVYLVGDAGPSAQGVTAARNNDTSNAYYYSTWWSASINSMSNMWSNLGSRPRFGTVSNGFRPPNGSCPSNSACYGRWKGTGDQIYRQQWANILNRRPEYAIITSYNEWPEGHYIEKSINYGEQYLNLSKEFIRLYRQ